MFGRPEPQCSAGWTSVLPQYYYSRKSSLRLDVDFETSRVSVSLPGATARASCNGWMFLLANSSIIDGNFQFSSPTGILLLSAFLSLSSKSLARYLRSKTQGIEESHVDFHSARLGRVYSKMVKNNFRMPLLTPIADAFSA